MDRRTSIIGFLALVLGYALHAGAQPAAGPNNHRLVIVSAGEYALGSSSHRFNKPHRLVTQGFYISDAETTNAQFAAFVAATGYITVAEKNGWSLVGGEGSAEWEWRHQKGADWRHPFGPDGQDSSKLPDHPVTQICGDDARAYCRWIGGRLPTLDEWETAARAGSREVFPWGKTFEPKRCNTWNGNDHLRNTRLDGFVLTAPVRSFPPNAWGLYDVIGNVFEYCEGMPPWMNSKLAATRICGRGGSWWCSSHCCSFHNLLDIGSMIRTAALPNQGFRVVFDLGALPNAPSPTPKRPALPSKR